MQKNDAVHKKKPIFFPLFLLSCICLLSGCTSFASNASTSASSSAVKATVIVPTPSPTPDPVKVKAQLLLNNMSLDDKLAQMIMVDYVGTDYTISGLQQMVAQQQVGAVLYQPGDPAGNLNFDPPDDTIASISAYSAQIKADETITPLIAIDEEGGLVDKISQLFPPAPSAETLAQSGDPMTAYNQAKLDASELKQLGINVDLAPVVDVGPYTPLYQSRFFSANPDTVATYAGNFIKGLQENGIAGTLKHFPGLGSTDDVDPHTGLPIVTKSLQGLQQSDFLPYQKIIPQDDPAMVMTTDVTSQALDATVPAELSPKVISYLRTTLNFNGVIITDALNMDGLYPNVLSGAEAEATDDEMAAVSVQAVEAGNDMIEGASTPAQVSDDITALTTAIQQGKLAQSQVDASVLRILMMKVKYGIIK
jgi:beta-N-acetylhexosaminidase